MKVVSLLTVLFGVLFSPLYAQEGHEGVPSRRISWQDLEATFYSYFVPYGFNPDLLWKKSNPKSVDSLQVIYTIENLVNRWIQKKSYYYWNELLNIPTTEYFDYAYQYLESCEGCERSIWSETSASKRKDVHPGEYLGCFLRKQLQTSAKRPIPEFFKLYAAIESSFNPISRDRDSNGKIRSIRLEKGLWQMYQETAIRSAGIVIDEDVDERLNPLLSTQAAATLMGQLYEVENDWEPVIAMYNQGEKRVSEFKAQVEKKRRRKIPKGELLLSIWDDMTPTTRNVYQYFIAYVLFMHEYGHGCARPMESIQLPKDTGEYFIRNIESLNEVFDEFVNRF